MDPYYSDDFVTLYHGDCREITEWLTADVLVTDPPYGVAYESNQNRDRRNVKRGRPIMGDSDTSIRDKAIEMWGDARPALVFGRWDVVRPARTRRRLVWDKGNIPGMGDLTLPWGSSDEEVYVLGTWPPAPSGGLRRDGGKPRRLPSVVRLPAYNSMAADRPDHPTPKPPALMEILLRSCPPGVVADPFTGSGPTLIAAKLLARKAIGVEFEERYCEIAARRLAQDALPFGEAI